MSTCETTPTALADLWVTERSENTSRGFRITKILHHALTPYQVLDIVETVEFGRMLLLDGLVMTTDRDEFVYHEMISHVPMLAHPEPKQVLIIGGGDGGTVREVLKHPSVERAVLAEIDGEVVRACQEWFPAIAGQITHPKVDLQVGDGIAYVANAPDESFDVVIVDSSEPIGPGEGLFTREFYTHVRRILKPNGVVSVQSDSPVQTPELVQKIVAKLAEIFPHTYLYTGHVPTYPTGLWSWTYAGKAFGPFDHVTPQRQEAITETTKYYHPGIHRAAFQVPKFVQQLVQEARPTCQPCPV